MIKCEFEFLFTCVDDGDILSGVSVHRERAQDEEPSAGIKLVR